MPTTDWILQQTRYQRLREIIEEARKNGYDLRAMRYPRVPAVYHRMLGVNGGICLVRIAEKAYTRPSGLKYTQYSVKRADLSTAIACIFYVAVPKYRQQFLIVPTRALRRMYFSSATRSAPNGARRVIIPLTGERSPLGHGEELLTYENAWRNLRS